MIKYLKLADAIKYIEHQIKDTEYFMIEPLSFLKEAIKTRKVIPLFSFKGHATICEAYRTRFEDVRQTMKVSGYFTVPYSLPEYEDTMISYGVELDKVSITVSQGIVYDLSFVDVIQFTAPFQSYERYEQPNFHDHIQIERNDYVNLYKYKPFLDDKKMYYASDSYPENRMYDEIEVKTDDLHFEFSHLKALFTIDTDKIGTPTLIQGEPKTDKQLIAELQTELAQVKAQLKEQTDKPAHAAIDEGQGDTLLILGAVMDCIESIAKPNYTQQSLITAITDKYKNTSSLTQSTLTKKFPKAKTHLKQNVTP